MSLRLVATLSLLIGSAALVPSNASCNPQIARTVLHAAALTAENLDCIFGDAETDPVKQAKNCHLEDSGPEIFRAIENLIGARDAGRRAGVAWKPLSDASAHAPSRDASSDGR